MSIAQQEFTNAGRAMLGRAQNSEVLHILKIVVGSGHAAQPSDLWPLTALIAPEMDVTISARRDFGNGTLMIEGSFRSIDASRAFDLREAGIMASVGGIGAPPEPIGQLYSVANCFTDVPDHIDPAAPTIQVFKIKLIIDRIPTGQLVIQIGPTENVMGENTLDDSVGPGVYKETLGNVLRFKRLIAGSRIELIEDTNEDSITVGVKTLKANLDLYVPQTYPGVPDPNSLFPTIQAALDSVSDVIVPPDKFVTVHVYSGHFTTPFLVTHPNASQIQIVGQPVVAVPVTGAIVTSGTLPNISAVLNVASLNGIAVNDVVYLYDSPHAQLEACGIVTATRPTPTPNITVKFQIQAVVPPLNLTAGATTKLLLFPSQMVSTLAATAAFAECRTGLGLLKNFGLRNTAFQVGNGVTFQGNGALENVALCNYNYGVGSGNGVVTFAPICAVNGCGIGITAGPSGAFQVLSPTLWQRVSWSGCSTYAIWLVAGAYTGGGGSSTWICSNGTGVRADDAGFFGNSNFPATTGGIVVGFNNDGLVAAILGVIQTSLSALNAVQANVTWDILAQAGSQIHIVHNPNTSGRYSPANGVLGPDGAYITVSSP